MRSFPGWPLYCSLCLFQHSGINSSNAEVLALFNVTEADAGEYICKVSNYIGQANQSAWHLSYQNSKVTTFLFGIFFFFLRRLNIEAEKDLVLWEIASSL